MANRLISDFEDYDAVFAEVNHKGGFTALTPIEAFQLLNTDSSLREWVRGGRVIFIDGYFVLADKKYVAIDDGKLHLTAKAKKNLGQCAI